MAFLSRYWSYTLFLYLSLSGLITLDAIHSIIYRKSKPDENLPMFSSYAWAQQNIALTKFSIFLSIRLEIDSIYSLVSMIWNVRSERKDPFNQLKSHLADFAKSYGKTVSILWLSSFGNKATEKSQKKFVFLFEKILKKKMPLPSFIGCPIEDVATPGNNPIKLKIVGKMNFYVICLIIWKCIVQRFSTFSSRGTSGTLMAIWLRIGGT